GGLKLPFIQYWVDDFLAGGEKLMVGGLHYHVLEPLRDRYLKRCVLVNGKVPEKQRQPLFDKFNFDPACDLFLGNLKAAGTGWSCMSTSHSAVIELPWAPAHL